MTGEVVAEKQNALYVDLGYDLLRVPRDQITSRSKVDESTAVVKTTPGGVELDPSGFLFDGRAEALAGQGTGQQVWRGGDLDRDAIGQGFRIPHQQGRDSPSRMLT